MARKQTHTGIVEKIETCIDNTLGRAIEADGKPRVVGLRRRTRTPPLYTWGVLHGELFYPFRDWRSAFDCVYMGPLDPRLFGKVGLTKQQTEALYEVSTR